MNKWMVLGSSPSAKTFFNRPEVDVVAGAGLSILLRRPDLYFMVEEQSLWLHVEERAAARALGTKVIMQKRLLDRMVKLYQQRGKIPMGAFPHDATVEVFGALHDAWRLWERGKYVNTCAGAVALQWAVNHGAEEIHMVGMEGYDEGVMYFTGEQKGKHTNKTFSEKCYVPLIWKIVAGCPDVQFVFYGSLKYSIKGDNVRLVTK